jgi:hypothetical protein
MGSGRRLEVDHRQIAVGEAEGDGLATGVPEGDGDGLGVTAPDAEADGQDEAEDGADGVGATVGLWLGAGAELGRVGEAVGRVDGTGASVGDGLTGGRDGGERLGDGVGDRPGIGVALVGLGLAAIGWREWICLAVVVVCSLLARVRLLLFGFGVLRDGVGPLPGKSGAPPAAGWAPLCW